MTSWPTEYGRIILDQTDSTNAEAARQASTLAAPTWILAHSQTAARGRRGRPWAMPTGNFAATLVLFPNDPPETIALRSFVAALALHDAFVSICDRADIVALKWPNDVLLNGGKVAGILLESATYGTRANALAIGFGINLVASPRPEVLEIKAVKPVSLLGETGIAITPTDFLTHLAEAYANWENQFTTFGFAPIRTAWLARATRLGQPIIARTTTDEVTGIFETVDSAGALVISTPNGRQTVSAADVFF